MIRTQRVFTVGALILCFMSAEVSTVLCASDDAGQTAPAQVTTDTVRFTISDNFFTSYVPPTKDVWRNTFTIVPADSSAFGQRGFRGRGRGRNQGAATAIILGSVAAIAGTAVLVYANRPDCSLNPRPGGCGYGTKVVGGAVLSAGVVGILVGALTWR